MEYFSAQLTTSEFQRMNSMAVCSTDDRYRSEWFVTVKLEDGPVYHYKLEAQTTSEQLTTTLSLKYRRTEGQLQRDAKNEEGFYWGCLGRSYRDEFSIKDEVIWGGRKAAYAPKSVVVDTAFDDKAKALLRLAAEGLKRSIDAEKTTTPNEATWGGQP